MNKSILLVNQSSGYLMVDIVNAYVSSEKYEKVEFFVGQINIRPSVPDPAVRIIKTVKYNKNNTIMRFLTWIGAFLHLLFIVWRRGNDCELLLVSNPPLTAFIPLFTRKKYGVVVYDLYPDSLFSQGLIKKNSAIGKWWISKNNKVFANAECVFTLSEDMKKACAQYVDESKIKIVYNWAHNEHMKPIEKKNNTFLMEHHLEDKFIVLYSGNMGMTHDIDVLVDVADRVKDNKKIHFIFIGEGAKKTIIKQKIKSYKLTNCTVLPFQPLEILPFSMGAADIAVVSTDNNQSGLSLPSKTYAYMATGSALLCLANKNTELGRLTRKQGIGQCFDSSNIEEIASFVGHLAHDENSLNGYKENSRKTSLLYTQKNAMQYIM